MKILDSLKTIILESRFKKPKPFTTPDGFKFYFSTHNTIDRKGNLNYDEIRDIILYAIDSGNKVHTRVAAPNLMVYNLIRNKYKKILNEFSKDHKEEKIKFVFRRYDNEDEEVFDYIEFIIGRDSKDVKTFNVVSSTFSSNGNYLGLFGKDAVQARKVMLEKYFHLRTIIL